MSRIALHEQPVPREERLRRVRRLLRPRVWRSLLLGLTDPVNDPHWAFIHRRDTPAYMTDPVPWFAPGSAEHLEALLSPGAKVFEWGSGSSTLWFTKNGAEVTSFETHEGWAADVAQRGGDAVDVRFMPIDEAYRTPDLAGYDVVLIDGRDRNACGLHCAETSPLEQVVVFDDSHREAYREAIDALSTRARWQRHWPGLSAMMTPKATSIFVI